MPSGKSQSTLRTFGKVSKANAYPASVKTSKEALAPSNTLCSRPKRKRDESDEDVPSTVHTDELAFDKVFAKKPKIRYATPPPSDPAAIVGPSPSSAIKKLSLTAVEPKESRAYVTPEDLPESVQDIVAIHKFLLHAMSLHFAHNGRSPAEITALCKTITACWRKRRVTKADLQRVFAIYELAADHHIARASDNTLSHHESFFKITVSGAFTCVDYVRPDMNKTYRGGYVRNPFDEKILQVLFKADIMSLYLRAAKANNAAHLSFLDGPLSKFPLLRCEIGAQTEQRLAKAHAARTEVMDVAKASQSRQNAKPVVKQELSTDTATPEQASQQLKSRTLSLFERVKAKQLANAAKGAPTPQTILRQHAIGRLGEVVEILRMKQQQKQSPAGFGSTSEDETSSVVKAGKVAFGFNQIIQEIKNSVSVPIQDDEARMCLELLSQGEEGKWFTIFALGSVKSVVLQGSARGGVEIQKEFEEKEKVGKA